MRKINIYVTKVIAILIVFYLTITVVLFISIGDTQPYEIIIYKRGLDSYQDYLMTFGLFGYSISQAIDSAIMVHYLKNYFWILAQKIFFIKKNLRNDKQINFDNDGKFGSIKKSSEDSQSYSNILLKEPNEDIDEQQQQNYKLKYTKNKEFQCEYLSSQDILEHEFHKKKGFFSKLLSFMIYGIIAQLPSFVAWLLENHQGKVLGVVGGVFSCLLSMTFPSNFLFLKEQV